MATKAKTAICLNCHGYNFDEVEPGEIDKWAESWLEELQSELMNKNADENPA